MSPKPNCLVCVGDRVYQEFFTEDLFNAIRKHTNLKIEVIEWLEEEEYKALITSFKPEIVITGWGSPKLTKAIHEQTGCVKLLLHTAGLIRNTIEKAVMESGVVVTNWG